MSSGGGTTPPSSGSGGVPAGCTTAPCPLADLEIVDMETGTVLSGSVDRMVGQQIRLLARSKPAGHAVTDVSWTVPDKNVKSYDRSKPSGKVKHLLPADLMNKSIVFYFIELGTKAVSVNAKVEGVAKSATVTFNVLRPTVDHFTVTPSSVTISTAHWAFPGSVAMAALQPTPPPMKFGCQWDAKVTAPAIGAGKVAFTQFININRSWTSNGGATRRYTSSGGFVLDDALGIEYSGAQSVAASSSCTLNGNAYADSPGHQLLATDANSSASDSFHLYLMYRPQGAHSIWVTLQRADWSWHGSAQRTGAPTGSGNNWTFASPPGMTPSGTTNGSDTTRLPEWSNYFSNLSVH